MQALSSTAPHSSITPHSSSPPPRSDCASTHRHPAEIDHKPLQPLSGFGRSLQPRNVELFEDGVGGDALDPVVTDLTSDVSQGSGPGADGLMVSHASRRQSNP